MTILIALVTIKLLAATNVDAKNLEIATKLATCQNAMEHPLLGIKAIAEFDLAIKLQYAITAIHGEYKPIPASEDLINHNQKELASCKNLINHQDIFDINPPISDFPNDPYIRLYYCESILSFTRRSIEKGSETELFLQNMQHRLISARLYLHQFGDITNDKATGNKLFSQYLDKTGGAIEEREALYCTEMAGNL